MKPLRLFTKIFLFAIIQLIIFTSTNINYADELFQSDDQPKYSQVRIFITSDQDIQRLTHSGLFIDHGIRKQNFLETWLSEEEISMLKSSGVRFEITIADWYSYYNSLPKMSPFEIQQAMQESIDNYNVSHSI